MLQKQTMNVSLVKYTIIVFYGEVHLFHLFHLSRYYLRINFDTTIFVAIKTTIYKTTETVKLNFIELARGDLVSTQNKLVSVQRDYYALYEMYSNRRS